MDVWQRAVADLRDSSETAGAVSQVGGKLDCRERDWMKMAAGRRERGSCQNNGEASGTHAVAHSPAEIGI